MPRAVLALAVFVSGAAVGSFLNVCIYRLPREESVVRPPSHCPFCHTRLRVADLCPLLSQLWLRGRCRYCGQPIHWRYFGVELLTAVLFLLTYLRFAWTPALLPALVLVTGLIAVFFIDLDHYIIPDELTYTIAAVGVVFDLGRLVTGSAAPLRWSLSERVTLTAPTSVVGLIFAAAVLWTIAWIGSRLFKKESMGGGDVKLAGAVGAHLGFAPGLLTFFLLAILLGALTGIALMLTGRRRSRDYIPFGPMLAVGAVCALLCGPWMTPALLRLYTLSPA